MNRKRKAEEANQEGMALIADARAKISRTASKSSKLCGIASLLQPLMA